MRAIFLTTVFFIYIGISLWPDVALSEGLTPSFTEGMEKAKAQDKIAIVKFETKTCRTCKRLNKLTFANPEVIEELKDFVVIDINVYAKEPRATYRGEVYTYRELARHFKIRKWPTLLFLRSNGDVIDSVKGFVPKGLLLKILAQLEKAP